MAGRERRSTLPLRRRRRTQPERALHHHRIRPMPEFVRTERIFPEGPIVEKSAVGAHAYRSAPTFGPIT